MNARSALSFVLSLALAVPALADEIHLVDGSVLRNVEIQRETLAEVAYVREGEEAQVPSEQVLAVEYRRGPDEVDRALAALSEGDLAVALGELEDYVERQTERQNERRFPWAPAFAAWKTVELSEELGDLEGAVAAAERLREHFPESRYVPLSHLVEAQARFALDQTEKARATLDELSSLADERQLSRRWPMEARVAALVADADLGPEKKREELSLIAREAGSEHPIVRSRARVAIAESLLAEAEDATDASRARELRQEARALLEEVVAEGLGDDEALAGAYTALGDTLYFLGADAEDPELLREAVLNYLRVATLYEGEVRYVPRALYFAMRTFALLEDRQRQEDMRRELVALYPGSHWAQEARKF